MPILATEQNFVAKVNDVLKEFYGHFSAEALPLFNGDLPYNARYDKSIIVASTVSHRFMKKFMEPTNEAVRVLTDACYDDWLSHEETLKSHDFYAFPPGARGVVYRARELIHKWFEGATFKLHDVDLEFTPGETYVGAQGYVSIYQKLRRKDAWCVTHDAVEDFIRLCYNNLSLKRCAKQHMVRLSKEVCEKMWDAHKGASHVGFSIFRARMLIEVLTVVHGSRASSVEKNAKTRRFINVEPLCNMILQRADACVFREVLRSQGNDLQYGQEMHQLLIQDPDSATIDFTRASDSTLLLMCKLMFPRHVYKVLDRHRSPMVLVRDSFYIPAKLSSMGNGYTFEVMSTILLAIARSLDGAASVYGDDVIIRNFAAHQFIEAAEAVGYKVNSEKTFINSPLRESCGAFYLDGYGYIDCFDIKWCLTPIDAITAVNKVYIMAQQESACKQLCTEAYEALIRCVPPCFMGPPCLSLHSDYAFCRDYRKKHMRSSESRQLWCNVVDPTVRLHFATYNYAIDDFVLVRVPRMQLSDASKRLRHMVRTDPDTPFRYAAYLYAGRISEDVIRGTGEVVYNLHFLHKSGVLFSAKEVKSSISEPYVLAVLLMYLLLGFRPASRRVRRKVLHWFERPDIQGPMLQAVSEY